MRSEAIRAFVCVDGLMRLMGTERPKALNRALPLTKCKYVKYNSCILILLLNSV
jgi:hypothetical protein